MNIVVVSICYPPEIRSISTMVREFCEYLAHKGHTVTVLTGWPQYNLSQEDERRAFQTVTIERGVRVIRIKTLPTHKVAYLLRGVAQVLLPPLFMWAFRKHVRERVDAVVVYSPHLPLTVVGNRIKRKTGARYLLNIQDIFPQGAIDLGILKNTWIIKFFERMERRAYEAADAITTCTNRARNLLVERKHVPIECVTVVPNWIDAMPYDHAQATGALRAVLKLESAFLMVFPGILGPTQGLDFVLDVAKVLRDHAHIHFVFVGDGTETEHLQKRVRDEEINNVHFRPFVSPDAYPSLLKEADAGLLSLRMDCKTPTVPGKLYSFMASGLPVVAFLNPESEGHEIIQTAQCGLVMKSRDAAAAARLVLQLAKDAEARKRYGESGRAYVKRYVTKEVCISQLLGLLVDE